MRIEREREGGRSLMSHRCIIGDLVLQNGAEMLNNKAIELPLLQKSLGG